MPITKDQARDLGRAFLDLSHALGNYRFDHWGDLTPSQRTQIESSEWSLLNASSDLTTTAVGIELDDMEQDLDALKKATDRALAVVDDLERVKDILSLAAAAVTLGGAIVSQQPAAIATAAKGLLEAAKAVS